MSVGVMGNIGAGIRAGNGSEDRGFTQVGPPGLDQSAPGALSQGTTIVAIAAAVWLAILFLHWKQY